MSYIENLLYNIIRTDMPLKAIRRDVYVDKLDKYSNNLRDCCMRVLSNSMTSEVYYKLIQNMSPVPETIPTILSFFHEDFYDDFLDGLITINCPTERTIDYKLIFTTDPDVSDITGLLPCVKSDEEDVNYDTLESTFNPKHIYIVKLLSYNIEGNESFSLQDILVFLPERFLLA